MASLIDAASQLARTNPTRPSQSYLKRAVSTAYYALFEALASLCADSLVGGRRADNRAAWARVYRSVNHGTARSECRAIAGAGFSAEIVSFASTFVELQHERHKADYDPDAGYTRIGALALVSEARKALAALNAAPRQERRNFAAHILCARRQPHSP